MRIRRRLSNALTYLRLWKKPTAEKEALALSEADKKNKKSLLKLTERSDTEEVADVRNVSGLSSWHRDIVNGRPPPFRHQWQFERKALRLRFAKFGRASQVDPAILWPSDAERADQMEVDRHLAIDFDREMDKMNEQRSLEERKRLDRLAKIEKNFANYPKMLLQYEKETAEVEKAATEQEKKLKQQIREVQEYFGYWIDPTDPRFNEMLEKKKAEEENAKKAAKKAELQRKKIAALSQS